MGSGSKGSLKHSKERLLSEVRRDSARHRETAEQARRSLSLVTEAGVPIPYVSLSTPCLLT